MMTKPERIALFKTASDSLKLALRTAEAMEPAGDVAMAERLSKVASQANAACNAYYNAMRGEQPPTVQPG